MDHVFAEHEAVSYTISCKGLTYKLSFLQTVAGQLQIMGARACSSFTTVIYTAFV